MHRNQNPNDMKRESLAIIFACFALALTAQDVIKVNYKGAQPTISDFVSALVSATDNDEEDCCVDEAFNFFADAWNNYHSDFPPQEGETLTIDEKNGYVRLEYSVTYETLEHVLIIEMCYWNEADGKHKLIAKNVVSLTNGKFDAGQFDGITFYRYDNAKKTMTLCDDHRGLEAAYDVEDVMHTFALPRTGKDITVTYWHDSGQKERTLKWNGHRFGF